MITTYGKLKEQGMETVSIATPDEKGRIVIPSKIRKKSGVKKYLLCTIEDLIILKGC